MEPENIIEPLLQQLRSIPMIAAKPKHEGHKSTLALTPACCSDHTKKAKHEKMIFFYRDKDHLVSFYYSLFSIGK